MFANFVDIQKVLPRDWLIGSQQSKNESELRVFLDPKLPNGTKIVYHIQMC